VVGLLNSRIVVCIPQMNPYAEHLVIPVADRLDCVVYSQIPGMFYISVSYNENDAGKQHMVRTNEVAPIIIRNCREEFQHVSDFKDPVVYGCIADGMVQHPLIRVRCSQSLIKRRLVLSFVGLG
jgi:hypothetical protein